MSKGRPTVKSAKLIKRILKETNQGLSLTDIAKIDGMPTRTTIYRWLKSDPKFKARFYESGDMHHIKMAKNRPYSMRVTISQGKNIVGKRLTISLKTYDAEEAKKRRDTFIEFFRTQGVKLLGEFPRIRKRII